MSLAPLEPGRGCVRRQAGTEQEGTLMRKLMFLAAVLVAVVGASVAYSASSPGAKLKKQDRVWGGGYVASGTCSINVPTFCPPGARNAAVDAHAEGDGSGAAGNAALNNATSITVTCLRVEGHAASVGGVIEATAPGASFGPGDYFLEYFVDRGTSWPASQRDLASGIFAFPPTEEWPAGFPNVCPPADGSAPGFPAFYLELLGGDITVQDAPSN